MGAARYGPNVSDLYSALDLLKSGIIGWYVHVTTVFFLGGGLACIETLFRVALTNVV